MPVCLPCGVSIGLDENNCPVIIEYKRHSNENVINQGLYYLDWLLAHRAEFRLLVMETCGRKLASNIEWKGARVLCIAADFNRYDEHAVAQIGRNIELIRYKYFGDDLLMLEWVNPVQNNAAKPSKKQTTSGSTSDITATDTDSESEYDSTGNKQSAAAQLRAMPQEQQELYRELTDFVNSLGEDVIIKELQLYIAFRRMKNFACLCPMKDWFKIWLRLDPDTVELEENFSRDVRGCGHWGTGDLEISLHTLDDLEKARPLLERAYLES